MNSDNEFFTPAELQRIAAERRVLNLRPWEFAPSEVRDTECPYPEPSVRAQWAEAAALWREHRAARRSKAKFDE